MPSAEDRARQQGCSVMTLEVVARATARGVYARLGYHEQTLKLAKRPGQI